jgi:hypothetical protein
VLNKIKHIFILVFILSITKGHSQKVGIGEWDSYFTLTNMYDVVEGPDGKIFWVSELSAMFYDPSEQMVTELNKIDGLTQTGFTQIVYNSNTKTIACGYNDGNIDLITLDGNNKASVVNMSDIKHSSITGDKKIYSLFSYNNFVYVSCGFGIVVVDMVNHEIKDTYIIGSGSAQVKVNGVAIGSDTIYATTDNGIYKAYAQNPFLNYYTAWSKMTSLPAWLINKSFKAPAYINNRLFIIPDYTAFGADTMYYRESGSWIRTPLFLGADYNEVNLAPNGNLVFACYGNVGQVSQSMTMIDNLFQYAGNSASPRLNTAIISTSNLYYTADQFKGPMQCINSYASLSLLPGGTITPSVRRLAGDADQLWVAPGHVESTIFSNTFNTDFFSVKEGNTWSYIDEVTDPILLNQCYDVLDVTIDPLDPTHVMAASWSFRGLIEIKNKKVVTLYDTSNSILFSPVSYPGFCGVASVLYDKDGNLWCLNGQANKPLVVKTADNNWKAFYLGAEAAERTYFDLAIDENKYVYVPVPTRGANAGGLAVYNCNGTITDESDDQSYYYKNIPGAGNLPDADVRCVAIDLDGQVWVGTVKGPCVIYNATNIFSGTADAQRILIEQDGNVQILLETEQINCIKVDGANRKWIGTENSGVFLLSEDGQEQIFHFSQENSPMPSNQVDDIEINPKTGEVFFATANGLISYRGTATESNAQFDKVHVFPNPVLPGYTGVIAINGLSRNSDIKITDIAGNIVNVVKSEGGQAIWDGNNLKGQRVKSGVYMFLCAKEDGSDKIAGKVMIIE